MKHFEALHLILINQSNQVICLVKARNKDKNIKLLFQNKSMKFIKNKETSNEEIMGMYFKRDTASFYQINYLQNIKMISLVLKYFSPQIQDKILDLFCGCGNFSLFLAREGADIIGVDSNAFAVNEAKHNARLNNIQNCHFMTADVDTISSHLLNDRFHGVLLNPPRSGCSQRILKEIGYANPETIVYVSCNPTTLARDLRVLINSSYLLEDVQPIDIFPQTYHIETVVKLKRK
jgi:23S rRNA (uracil1939-C5)-methyltransferase